MTLRMSGVEKKKEEAEEKEITEWMEKERESGVEKKKAEEERKIMEGMEKKRENGVKKEAEEQRQSTEGMGEK